MYWRDFEFVDELPETGGVAVCYIKPDNSLWEYSFVDCREVAETGQFDENQKPIYEKRWMQRSGQSSND